MTFQYAGRKPRAFRGWAYGTALLLTVLFLAVAGCPLSEQQVRSEPEVTIGAAQDGVTEGEAVSFTVTAKPAPAADLVVSVTVTETGATLADSVPQQVQVTIAAGQTTETLQVETVDDTTDESDSTVTATVDAGAGYTIGSSKSAVVTVTDNDEPADGGPAPQPAQPQVTIAADGDGVTEGEAVSFTVTAMPAPAMDLMVNVTVTETGATLDASVPVNVTIAAGQTTETLQVETVDDTTDEPDSTVTATVDAGAGYTVGSPNSAGVTVVDNDSASTPTPTLPPATPDLPHVTITAGPSPVTEGQPATFTVTANPAPAANVDVRVTVTETGDTNASGTHNPTILAGTTSVELSISTANDTTDEPDSRVTARVNSGNGYTVARPSSALVTVANDDETVKPPDDGDPLPGDPPPGGKPTVSITGVPSEVTEGHHVDITLTADPAPTERISGIVTFTDSDTTIGSLDNTFTFDSGDTTSRPFYTTVLDGANVSRTLTISLATPVDDSHEVSSETKTVTINDSDDD